MAVGTANPLVGVQNGSGKSAFLRQLLTFFLGRYDPQQPHPPSTPSRARP